MKKWSSRLGVEVGEAEAARDEDGANGDQAGHPAEQLLVPQDGQRHEHVGQEVDDVVEAGAVNPRGVPTHVHRARREAVGGIDEDGQAQPEEGRARVVIPRAPQRKPPEEGTRRRVGVDRDGGCAAGKGHGPSLV